MASSVAEVKRKTLYYLLGGLCLSVGTPIYLGLSRPDLKFYLFQPMIFAVQVVPYLVAAGLWLPWRSPRANKTGQVLASVLFVAALLLYVPIVTGLLPTGGDMVGLGYFLIAIGTTVSVLLASVVAVGMLWLRNRGSSS